MLFPARFILHSFVYTCFEYFVAPLIWSLEQAIAFFVGDNYRPDGPKQRAYSAVQGSSRAWSTFLTKGFEGHLLLFWKFVKYCFKIINITSAEAIGRM